MALEHDRSRIDFQAYAPRHFRWKLDGKVATITLDRPERKNPLTFESYAELRDTFRELVYADSVKAVVLAGSGGNFCSGGDVHEIIGPLVAMQERGEIGGLLDFTRMTGDLVKAMRACPQPIVAAVDGVCAGAGAILAMASDLRLGTSRSKVAFLFVRVGLAGADMGACNILPRIIGAGRAAELLYTGRAMSGDEAERWGFFNRLVAPESVIDEATSLAHELCSRAYVCACDDQEVHPRRMEHADRRRHRGRGPGAGALHADQGLRPGVSCVPREAEAGLRRKLIRS